MKSTEIELVKLTFFITHEDSVFSNAKGLVDIWNKNKFWTDKWNRW